MVLRIWCNLKLSAAEAATLATKVAPHELLYADPGAAGAHGSLLGDADIAFGQPDVEACLASPRIAWVHLSSAGWEKFDQPRVHAALRARGAALTTSASVYSEPCAQHLLAFMLAECRRLPSAWRHQLDDRAWSHREIRATSMLLGPAHTVLIVGFGNIARRLVELLAPFGARVIGVRRRPTGSEPVRTIAINELPSLLGEADHVIDILPGGAATQRTFDALLFGSMKPSAVFYNIGRGTSVDQAALCSALETGRLRAAYLDVTDPEPLPPEHPLWRAPRCFITPHSAGGHVNESARLASHLLQNLARFTASQPLLDRVV